MSSKNSSGESLPFVKESDPKASMSIDVGVQVTLYSESVNIQEKALKVQFHLQDQRLKRAYAATEQELTAKFDAQLMEMRTKMNAAVDSVEGVNARNESLKEEIKCLREENEALLFRQNQMNSEMFALQTKVQGLTSDRDGLRTKLTDQAEILRQRVIDHVMSTEYSRINTECDYFIAKEQAVCSKNSRSDSIKYSPRGSQVGLLAQRTSFRRSKKTITIAPPKISEYATSSFPNHLLQPENSIDLTSSTRNASFCAIGPQLLDITSNEDLTEHLQRLQDEQERVVALSVGLGNMAVELQRSNAIANSETMEDRVREAIRSVHGLYLDKFTQLKEVFEEREKKIVQKWKGIVDKLREAYNETKAANERLVVENVEVVKEKGVLASETVKAKAELVQLAQHLQNLNTAIQRGKTDAKACSFCFRNLETTIIDIQYSFLKEKETIPQKIHSLRPPSAPQNPRRGASTPRSYPFDGYTPAQSPGKSSPSKLFEAPGDVCPVPGQSVSLSQAAHASRSMTYRMSSPRSLPSTPPREGSMALFVLSGKACVSPAS